MGRIVRSAATADLPEMKKLFRDTIREVNRHHYNEDQIREWVAGSDNMERWAKVVENQQVFIAMEEERIIGFISLENSNYIDFLFVHKDFQGKGVARQLYNKIENVAIQNQSKELSSDVSITARPFFEKVGFIVEEDQVVVRNGVQIPNFKMRKYLRG